MGCEPNLDGFNVKTSDSDYRHGYAPNLLPGKTITAINQVWVTDTTYIRIATGFVYLCDFGSILEKNDRVGDFKVSLPLDVSRGAEDDDRDEKSASRLHPPL